MTHRWTKRWHFTVKMETPTGWSWSMSGSNLVINRLHLSRSFICRGNQGTVTLTGGGKKEIISAFVIGLIACYYHVVGLTNEELSLDKWGLITLQDININKRVSLNHALAFFLWDGANVVDHSLQRVDENVEVRAVNFTLHEEFQVCRAVLWFPPWSTLNVEKFSFKRL